MSRVPPTRPNIASPPEFGDKPAGLSAYLRKLVDTVIAELQNRVKKTEPVSELLLIASNGKVFKVTVSGTGVLTTTEVAS